MLRLLDINKSFKAIKVLQNVSLHVLPGQVHALCGENGAGKSTLMHIISGSLQADSGEIYLNNQKVFLTEVGDAQKLGIAMVYQDRTLAGSLTVAENIFPVYPGLNRFGLIDFHSLYARTSALLKELGLGDISPRAIIDTLSPARQQMVEIARALALNPSLLVLDEPTASLTAPEAEILFDIIHKLAKRGTSVIYISHRMAEINKVADVVTVLKDGKHQGTFDAKTTTPEFIVQKMVGRDLDQTGYISHAQPEPVMSANKLTGKNFSSISFTLHKGEILGIAGLEGSGRTSLVRAIFGDVGISSGNLLLRGQEIKFKHPADAIAAGIAYLPEDRKGLGLFTNQDIISNIVAASVTSGWYNSEKNLQTANDYRVKVEIRCNSVRQLVDELSGGNQQKIVLAKWMNTFPEIFIVNEPTHGVDVGAKAAIYQELKKLTVSGKSILLVSSDLPELLHLSDRVLIMYNGKAQGILDRHQMSEERIASLASGFN